MILFIWSARGNPARDGSGNISTRVGDLWRRLFRACCYDILHVW